MKRGGIVLCGGQSTRMGRPKAWLPFGGEPMLVRALRLLAPVCDPLVAVAAPGQELPPLPDGVEVARDSVSGRGPLQGLAAGLEALGSRAEVAYVSSCDSPFVTAAFVERMATLLGSAAIAIPEVGGYRHPLAGVYRTDVLPLVRELLGADRLRPAFLFERVTTRLVTEFDLADVGWGSLCNLNTPEEYEAAQREAGVQ